MGLTEKLTAWSYRRQLLGAAGKDALAVIERLGGVYSSHPSAPLTLLCRSAGFDATAMASIEEQRLAVRLPAMRTSIFLVPAADAAMVLAATRVPPASRLPNLRSGGYDLDSYQKLKPRLLEQAQTPASIADLRRALGEGAGLNVVVATMAREGLLLRLSDSLRSDSLRFVATDAWLGRPLPEHGQDEARAWLATKYLDAFGPARARDFAWWAGLTQGRALVALAATDAVDVCDGFLLPASQRDAFESVEPVNPNAIDLLPKWDAYTMGYAADGRGRFLDDAHLRLAYTAQGGAPATSGDGLPLVLKGGRAVASWSHRFQGSRMAIEVKPFEPQTASVSLDESDFEAIGRLLGASAIDKR